ncbi:hypothetical protein OG21DRAFT_1603887 [Imleria badia]|nr:hypothetical protein OG21DRAFT_1603887 [Imleria badia]
MDAFEPIKVVLDEYPDLLWPRDDGNVGGRVEVNWGQESLVLWTFVKLNSRNQDLQVVAICFSIHAPETEKWSSHGTLKGSRWIECAFPDVHQPESQAHPTTSSTSRASPNIEYILNSPRFCTSPVTRLTRTSHIPRGAHSFTPHPHERAHTQAHITYSPKANLLPPNNALQPFQQNPNGDASKTSRPELAVIAVLLDDDDPQSYSNERTNPRGGLVQRVEANELKVSREKLQRVLARIATKYVDQATSNEANDAGGVVKEESRARRIEEENAEMHRLRVIPGGCWKIDLVLKPIDGLPVHHHQLEVTTGWGGEKM